MKVLIIGGGVAGPALALFLKKAGIESVVYEAYPQELPVGGAFSLQVNGMSVLNALGLAEAVTAAGAPVHEWLFESEGGTRLARWRLPVSPDGLRGVSLTRAALTAVLTGEMRRLGVTTHYGKALTRLECGENGVTAWFEDGSSAEGDILVGADGIHSRTRRQIFSDAPEPGFVGLLGFGGRVPRGALAEIDATANSRVSFTFGAQAFFGICGVDDGDLMWWANEPSAMPRTMAELGGADNVMAELRARCAHYHNPIPQLLEKSGPPLLVNIFDMQMMESWAKDRVVLIGDAAHAVSPNSGQGASMALEDAMMLAMALRDSPGYADAFAAFQGARKERCEKVVAFGRRAGRDKAKLSPAQARIRNIFIAIFFRLFGQRSMAWMSDYRIDWSRKLG